MVARMPRRAAQRARQGADGCGAHAQEGWHADNRRAGDIYERCDTYIIDVCRAYKRGAAGIDELPTAKKYFGRQKWLKPPKTNGATSTDGRFDGRHRRNG